MNKPILTTLAIPDYQFLTELADDRVRTEVMRELCRRDLYFLCRHVLGYKDLEPETDIHYTFCHLLDRADRAQTLLQLGAFAPDTQILRLLALLFRGSFKTSICEGKVIQWLLRDPLAQIGVGSDTADRAGERTRDIRDILENNVMLKSLFPDLFYDKPMNQADLWRYDEFNIKRPSRDQRPGGFARSSVNAFGLDPLPTGSHFTHVWLDDVENEANQNTPETIDKLNRNMRLFFPLLQPEAPVVMTGTIYSKEGPNTTFQRTWYTYLRPIYTANHPPHTVHTPTFPSKFPLATIQRLKDDINDEWTWHGQYLLHSMHRTDKYLFPFQRVQLQTVRIHHAGDDQFLLYEDGPVPLSETAVYITVDPSGGASAFTATKLSDKVGWWVVAVDKAGRWAVLEIGNEFLGDVEFLDRLFTLYDTWQPEVIAIEKDRHLDGMVRLSFDRHHRSLPIAYWHSHGIAKEQRIRSLLPLLPSIYFNEEFAATYQLRLRAWHTQQLHDDDDHDAGAAMIEIARAPTAAQIAQKAQRARDLRDDNRYKSLALPERRAWKKARDLEKRARNPQAENWHDELADFYC